MMEVQPHVKRMLDEASELNTKIAALTVFINENPIYKTLSEHDKFLLRKQLAHMYDYFYTLNERICRAGK